MDDNEMSYGSRRAAMQMQTVQVPTAAPVEEEAPAPVVEAAVQPAAAVVEEFPIPKEEAAAAAPAVAETEVVAKKPEPDAAVASAENEVEVEAVAGKTNEAEAEAAPAAETESKEAEPEAAPSASVEVAAEPEAAAEEEVAVAAATVESIQTKEAEPAAAAVPVPVVEVSSGSSDNEIAIQASGDPHGVFNMPCLSPVHSAPVHQEYLGPLAAGEGPTVAVPRSFLFGILERLDQFHDNMRRDIVAMMSLPGCPGAVPMPNEGSWDALGQGFFHADAGVGSVQAANPAEILQENANDGGVVDQPFSGSKRKMIMGTSLGAEGRPQKLQAAEVSRSKLQLAEDLVFSDKHQPSLPDDLMDIYRA